jgi:two-component system LytT family response regulator
MAKITCIVVDDEVLPRRHLLSLLEKEQNIEVVGQAERKKPAVELIDSLQPDLVFLDIRMPGGGGFEIVEEIRHKPRVIFVTAYDQYAVQAFDINAIDYLLKPVAPERLRSSLDRLSVTNIIPSLEVEVVDNDNNEARLLPLGNSGHFVPIFELLYVESEDHYTRVFVDGKKEFQIRQPLREWGNLLPDSTFVRIERGMILNVKKIVSANLNSTGGEVILGRSRIILQLGTRASQRLREFLRLSSN